MPPRVLLSIAVLVAFGASLTHGFHFDDYSVIRGPEWTAGQARPLTWLSFAANAQIATHPALWHLVNLLAHLAAVLLLYKVLLAVSPQPAALLGALIFAVHPIQAESVAYVYSRATLLSTALSLLSCLLFLGGRRWWAVAAFALALLSKEDCATVPLVIAALCWPRIRDKFLPLGAMVLLALLAAVRTLSLTRAMPGSNAGFAAGISPFNYLIDQGYVILRYLRLMAVPYGFSIDPDIRVSSAVAIACWLALAALVVLAWRSKQRWLILGLLLLVPSSSIFPLADLAADHRMYLPMTAFAGGAGRWLAKMPRWGSAAVVAVLILLSAQRMTVWASDEKLWSEAAERAPGKLRPRLQLSRALNPVRALPELKQTLTAHPNEPDVHMELGRVYLELGQPAMALPEFGEVLGQRPRDMHAILNRGMALRALGQEAAARQDFERALKQDACFADARQALGLPLCR